MNGTSISQKELLKIHESIKVLRDFSIITDYDVEGRRPEIVAEVK